jgi:CDP-diacylglycerol--serine O-phosphatidyltransferase
MFVLPNLFTVSSIFCGFYALTLCAGEASPRALHQAALAIFFGIFFDGFDGRVARLTRTQSAFGVELDSLADVITFGVAPGMLAYKWALQPLGLWGIVVGFAFAACGALRLARFNVIAQRSSEGGGGRFFVGLPIPIAAAMFVSLVMTHHASTGGEPLSPRFAWPVAGVVLFLSVLMVSTIKYRTFKDLKLSPRTLAVFAGILLTGVVVATRLHPAWVMVVYFACYLAFGLVETGLSLRGGATAGAAGGSLPQDGEDEQEFL